MNLSPYAATDFAVMVFSQVFVFRIFTRSGFSRHLNFDEGHLRFRFILTYQFLHSHHAFVFTSWVTFSFSWEWMQNDLCATWTEKRNYRSYFHWIPKTFTGLVAIAKKCQFQCSANFEGQNNCRKPNLVEQKKEKTVRCVKYSVSIISLFASMSLSETHKFNIFCFNNRFRTNQEQETAVCILHTTLLLSWEHETNRKSVNFAFSSISTWSFYGFLLSA